MKCFVQSAWRKQRRIGFFGAWHNVIGDLEHYQPHKACYKQEGLKEGRVGAFAEMVRDGVISIAEAAKRSGLTEAAFKKIAVL